MTEVAAASDAAPDRIVGIGASAGGLESLGALFDALPATTGMSFVVVQHLSPEFRTTMADLLARRTAMPVALAEHGRALVADRVYVLPPGKEMIVRGGRIVLSERPPNTFTWPIDTFLRALAHDAGPRAVAVILSGAGSDGARGLLEVKREGGIVLAESLDSARFDGMPRAALATGVVDHVLPAPALARQLTQLPPPDERVREIRADDDAPVTAREIVTLLHDRFGVDFTRYKATTVTRRIQRRLDLARIASLPAYLDELRARPDELDALYRDLLIGVTQFFRDPDAFAAVEAVAIPRLLELVPDGEPLRVWVAGCATGEEVYALAMLLVEAFTAAGRKMAIEIIASDVHDRSLRIAAEGRYSADQLTHVSDARIARFFVPRSDCFHVSDELRRLITFTHHDVTRDPPPTQIHLLSCRNLLIYFTPGTLRTVLAMFHFALVPGGVLFLGPSEMPIVLGDELRALDDHWKLYEKRPSGPPVSEPSEARDLVVVARPSRRRPEPRRPIVTPAPDPFTIEAYDQLLDLFMPPGFLIGEDRSLIDSFAGAEQWLRARPRRLSVNVLELLDEELRLVIASALQRAIEEGVSASYAGIEIERDGRARCRVVARPIRLAGHARAAIVTFEAIVREAGAARAAVTAEAVVAPAYDVEQLIASCEELQSINEQLQSVNEQLQTQQRATEHELAASVAGGDDLRELLEGSEVMALLVDRDLRLRAFTEMIAPIFRLQAADIGRPLADFAPTIVRAGLIDELAAVIATGHGVVEEVVDAGGARFRLYIAPRPTGAIVRLAATERA